MQEPVFKLRTCYPSQRESGLVFTPLTAEMSWGAVEGEGCTSLQSS